MSRSYKKAYAYFCGCRSQKRWRSDYNRRFRHTENARVRHDPDYSCFEVPYKFGYADRWCGPTDGGSFYNRPHDWWNRDVAKKAFCSFKRHGHYLFHK